MKSKYRIYDKFKVSFETPSDGYSYFFGYYDISPLSYNNIRMLAHRVSFDGRDVQDGDIAEIGFFDLRNGNFYKVDDTLAWNWQIGSRLQWLKKDSDELIIYNSIEDDRFVSIIYNIDSRKKCVIPYPIYCLHPNGNEALSIIYERHFWCREGYNYQNIKNSEFNVPFHVDDGIFRINLETGSFNRIISLKDIIYENKINNVELCNNWLEHIIYNPSGERFMFFHRWQGTNQHGSRVFIADSNNGGNRRMLPDTRFYSHYNWQDKSNLSIWTHNPKIIDKIKKNDSLLCKKNISLSVIFKDLKKILYKLLKNVLPKYIKNLIEIKSHLVIFNDHNGNYNIIEDGNFYINGHQTWFNDSKCVMIDSYQDKKGLRHLSIFDTRSSTADKVGEFTSLYNNCSYRCDLHPRLSSDNNFIIIDTAHEFKRKMIVIACHNEK